VLRTVIWALLVSLTQRNGPLDLIEWLSWGHEWRWGYHKHPPLAAWIAECFSWLSPGDVWGVYLASYLLTAACLWAVWRLGREMLSPPLALLAALSLDGMIFYTYDAAEFSNNVVLNSLWAVLVVCFYFALKTGRLRWWLATGLTAGLALLTKYTIVYLFAAMFLFLLLNAQARRLWRRPGPYLAALAALAVFAPHLIWMVRNDWITVQYALERSASMWRWFTPIKNPLLFALSQLGRLLPVFLVLSPLTSWRWRLRPLAADQRFDGAFLSAIALGPVALLLLTSLGFGVQLREIYGYPLWTFVGLLLLFHLATDTRVVALQRAFRCWGLVVVFFLGFTLIKNFGEPIVLGNAGHIHFPGKRLADELSRRWQECYASPFPLVAGECWLVGNVGCYTWPRPSVYPSPGLAPLMLDPRIVPWTSDQDVRTRGGILLWKIRRTDNNMPTALRAHFPDAQVQPPLTLPYAWPVGVPPLRVGVAFQPPVTSRGAASPDARATFSCQRGIPARPNCRERDNGPPP
jgi:hypothetical protein